MKYFTKILFAFILISSQIIAQSQEDYFNNALDLYMSGKYEQALETLNKVTSDDFDVAPLRSQILKELKKSGTKSETTPQKDNEQNKQNIENQGSAPISVNESNRVSNNSSGSDEEKYFKALELYQNGSYKDALSLLETINSKDIDTEPLKNQILKLIKKPELRPASGKKPDIKPFEYKIVKKNKNVEQQSKSPGITFNQENQNNNPSGFSTFFIVLLVILAIVLLGFLLIAYKKRSRESTSGLVLVLHNKTSGQHFKFKKGPICIGRDNDCEIPLSDKEVSRRHAEIVFDKNSNSAIISDLNSTNGIILNGKKTQSSKLSSGDNLKIGNQLFNINII